MDEITYQGFFKLFCTNDFCTLKHVLAWTRGNAIFYLAIACTLNVVTSFTCDKEK